MNKQKKLFIVIIALGIIFFLLPSTINSFFALVFLGIVPGTDMRVPFWIMLPASLLLALVLIRWITNQPLYIGSIETQEKTARALARKNVAKKVAKHQATTRRTRATAPKKHYRTVKT